jgi:hypothetical protein
MSHIEKRSFIRANIAKPVALRRQGRKWRQATSENLSVDGLSFRTHTTRPLNLGEQIELSLPAAWGGQKVAAKVVHAAGNVYGCQFVDLPAELKQLLGGIVYPAWQRSLGR